MRFHLVALFLALVVVGGTAGAADGRRSDNRKKPIVFIHGLARDSSNDCASTWNDMKAKVRDWGHTGAFTTIAYYRGDTNCSHWLGHHGRHSRHYASGHDGNGGHTADTDIRHLGYHLAWTIWNHHSRHGRRVDVVAHSMGGLIIRYALAQVQRGHDRFPQRLLVEDVVTMGTPHGGARWYAVCTLVQCGQMRAGSDFLVWLESNAWEPDGRGGTDWSTFGSDDDNWVAADRAAGTARDRDPKHDYIGSCHKVWYLPSNNIEHGEFLHDTSKRISADVYRFNCQSGSWVKDLTSHWPVRRADLAVTFGNR
jgi:hypothetical protein